MSTSSVVFEHGRWGHNPRGPHVDASRHVGAVLQDMTFDGNPFGASMQRPLSLTRQLHSKVGWLHPMQMQRGGTWFSVLLLWAGVGTGRGTRLHGEPPQLQTDSHPKRRLPTSR